jgi:hypothetical protein
MGKRLSPLLFVLALAPAAAWAAWNPPAQLRNLSAGTRLVARSEVLVRANDWEVDLGAAADGSRCRLRLRQAQPYDRFIRSGHEFRVSAVHRSGLTLGRVIETRTFVELDSPSVQDILCSGPRAAAGNVEMSDFTAAVGRSFEVILPTRVAELD